MKYIILTCLRHLCVIIFCSLPHKSNSADDPKYEACKLPRSCGKLHNISYPFYIQDQQKPYCGTPGFNLTCKQIEDYEYPLLRIAGDDYIVGEIFYNNQSIVISNAAAAAFSVEGCSLPKIRNISLKDDYRFFFLNEVPDQLYLLSECNSSAISSDKILSKYKIGCAENDRRGGTWGLAIDSRDSNLTFGKDVCKEVVATPREDEYEFISSEYLELLRRGFVLNWRAGDCGECEKSGGRCGTDDNPTQIVFLCYCRDRPHYRSCKSGKGSLTLILATGICGGAFMICLVLFIIWWRKKGKNLSKYFFSRNSYSDVEDGTSYFGVPIFSYKDLEEATHNFDHSKELGDGGFGTVFYGKLRDGREVAVKRLYENSYKQVEQFMNEIRILTQIRHRNLVLLYGSTSHRSRELILVYEYIPNGTVADHLHGEKSKTEPLTWPVRMKIAMETASALSYLHKSDIIHRDVKTNNILLDINFCVKVADFGLSRLFPTDATHVSTAPQGTPGYVDPEYHQYYQLTNKSDVYSFGVVLIELISSLPAVDISRQRNEINLANLAIDRIQRCAFNELIDPNLGYDSDANIERMTTSVAGLAFRCLQLDKDMRPTMDEVLECLEQIHQGANVSERVIPPPSPESDNAVLLKDDYKFTNSPVGVIEKWISSSSTTTSISG